MTAIRAYLDDKFLPIDSGASWSLKAGTSHHQVDLLMDNETAASLFENAEPHTSSLSMESDLSGESDGLMWVDGITILGTAPTNNPHLSTLTIADLRWAWPRRWVKRSYNVSIRTGRVRSVFINNARAEFDSNVLGDPLNVEAELDYATWSLKDGKKLWTAEEVLKDVIERLVGDAYIMDTLPEMPRVENLEIDSPGDIALSNVLQYLGGMVHVWVDVDGLLRVGSRIDGTEGQLVGDYSISGQSSTTRGGTVQVAKGFPTYGWSDRSMERPVKVRVLFTRSVEVRFDSTEGDAAINSGKTMTAADEAEDNNAASPTVENCLACPEDAIFPAKGEESEKHIVSGTLISLDEYLAYLETQENPEGVSKNITRELINLAYFLPALDLYALADTSGLWATRIGAIRECYRRVYRIVRPFNDRLREIGAYRKEPQDRSNHSFASSPAYQDYAFYQTWRNIKGGHSLAGPDAQKKIINVFCNPAAAQGGSIVNTALGKLRSSPATVSMLDPEQGLFSIDFHQDITAKASSYLHSAVSKVPSDDPTKDAIWLDHGALASDHELSVVLSGIPTSPNDERAFYFIELTQAEAGIPAHKQQKEGLGPVIEVRVAPTVQLAHCTWSDSKAADIKKFFAYGYQADEPAEGDPADLFGHLYGDPDATWGQPFNYELLMEIAKVKATQVYQTFVDSYEGGATTELRADLDLLGSAEEIKHQVGSQGAITTVTFAKQAPPVDLSQLLPDSVRLLVQKGGTP